jgi:hypothetical protein
MAIIPYLSNHKAGCRTRPGYGYAASRTGPFGAPRREGAGVTGTKEVDYA